MSTAKNTAGSFPPGLAGLVARADEAAPARPVDSWNPPYCGEIDMRVTADGTWHYCGSPIGRRPLVKLFASILRREPDGRHVLVTPVERIGIEVEDAPFLAVEVHAGTESCGQVLTFRTNLDDIVRADAEHALRFAIEPGTGGLKPYVTVRGRLEALATRPVALELAALAEIRDGRTGVASGGLFFAFPDGAGG